MSLQKLLAFRTDADADPRHAPAFVRVEAVRLIVDELHDVGRSVFLSAEAVGVRAADMSDVLMRAAPVRLIDAVNLIVGHGRYPFQNETTRPKRRAVDFREGAS